jgi:hypothetical protein
VPALVADPGCDSKAAMISVLPDTAARAGMGAGTVGRQRSSSTSRARRREENGLRGRLGAAGRRPRDRGNMARAPSRLVPGASDVGEGRRRRASPGHSSSRLPVSQIPFLVPVGHCKTQMATTPARRSGPGQVCCQRGKTSATDPVPARVDGPHEGPETLAWRPPVPAQRGQGGLRRRLSRSWPVPRPTVLARRVRSPLSDGKMPPGCRRCGPATLRRGRGVSGSLAGEFRRRRRSA